MKKKILLLITGLSLSFLISAQALFVPTGTNGVGNSANNNVGIGTSTPGAKLEVSGDIFGSLDNSVITIKDDNIGLVKKYADSGVWAVGSGYFHRFGKWSTPSLIGNVSTGVFTEQMRIANNGNVGIGTTNPGSKLVIADGSNGVSINSGDVSGLGFNRNVSDGAIYNPNISGWQFSARDERFSLEGYNGATHNLINILKNGNVGIGTISPITKLDVDGKLHVANDIYGSKVLTFQDDARFEVSSTAIPSLSNSSFSMPQYGIATPNTTGAADLWLAGYNAIRMFTAGNVNPVVNILYSGNVGIGTQNPDQKLTVKGKIHAEEVIIDLAVPADYVFKPNYKLMPLHQVEQFVKTNSHLPEIPSANEITKNGLSMGEMQNKLLQKVEELTLYVIELNKKNESLEKQIKELKQQ